MPGKRQHDCSGQVLVVVLLGMVLLGGMIFYVVNVGDQSNRRVEMQNAADSAAISGAAWMARSMNVIAMNNVAATRMLALVPILDAFPLSTKMGHEEVRAWVRCLEAQLERGVADSWLREGLESLKKRMARQRDVLAPMDDFFNNGGYQVETMTFWGLRGHRGGPPHGTLWQAAQSLDEMGQAAAISAPYLAQANAVRYGRSNQAETAFVVPILPELPARRTTYADFSGPVRRGLIPDRAPPHRLGPYDRLYKWRNYRYHNITQRGQLIPGKPGHGPIRNDSGNVNIAGRTSGRSARGQESRDHWSQEVIGRILLGYTVYGPFEWMRRRVHGYAQGWWRRQGYNDGELADTFFHEYHDKMARIKLGYMWGSQQLRKLHYPQWVVEYPTARALAQRPDVRVTWTMFYLVEIRSKHPKDHPAFMSPGTFQTNGDLPIALWVKGWEDPADWDNTTQLSEWVWENRWQYETTEDWEIGITRQNDATGQPIWQQVYMVGQYVFGGIDVGGEVEIRNPANFLTRQDLPAPILMDTAVGDYDVSQPHHDLGVRRDVFTYLGVASQKNTARIWPRRFASGNPFGGILALAQAEIFNTRSWGLWTQDWKVKLVPVTGWGNWTERMGAGIADAPATNGMVDPEVVQRIQDYLWQLAPVDEAMVNMMLQH